MKNIGQNTIFVLAYVFVLKQKDFPTLQEDEKSSDIKTLVK